MNARKPSPFFTRSEFTGAADCEADRPLVEPAWSMGFTHFLAAFCTLMVFVCPAHARTPSPADELVRVKYDADFLDGLVDRFEANKIATSPSFSSYLNAFTRYTDALTGQASNRQTLRDKLAHAELVLLGDWHANPRSQANVIWTMEQMGSGGAPRVLAVEWVERKFQNSLDKYMANQLSDDELRAAIDFDASWGFSWPDHLALLRAAKRLGFKVEAAENKHGLGGHAPIDLRARDNNVVKRVEELRAQGARVLLVYGEAHLAGQGDAHLSEKLARAGDRPDVIIFGQPNASYWQELARTSDPQRVEVLRFSDSQFYLDQGVLERPMAALRYYFERSGLNASQLNFVWGKLTSEAGRALRPATCRLVLQPNAVARKLPATAAL